MQADRISESQRLNPGCCQLASKRAPKKNPAEKTQPRYPTFAGKRKKQVCRKKIESKKTY